jgi:hypothetical protein
MRRGGGMSHNRRDRFPHWHRRDPTAAAAATQAAPPSRSRIANEPEATLLHLKDAPCPPASCGLFGNLFMIPGGLLTIQPTTANLQREHTMRLLFASIHSYLDPSGGAALSTRELLELLAARGADCRALTAGVLDYERETTLDEVLAGLDLPSQRVRADLGLAGSAEVINLLWQGLPTLPLPSRSSTWPSTASASPSCPQPPAGLSARPTCANRLASWNWPSKK